MEFICVKFEFRVKKQKSSHMFSQNAKAVHASNIRELVDSGRPKPPQISVHLASGNYGTSSLQYPEESQIVVSGTEGFCFLAVNLGVHKVVEGDAVSSERAIWEHVWGEQERCKDRSLRNPTAEEGLGRKAAFPLLYSRYDLNHFRAVHCVATTAQVW